MKETYKTGMTMTTTIETVFYSIIASLKNTFVYISGFVLSILLPIIPLIVVVGVLIMTDTVWGMVAAKKKGKWNKRGVYELVSKMAIYEGLLLLSFLFDKYLIGDIVALAVTTVPLFITKIVASILGGIELWSINGNIAEATGFDFIIRAKSALLKGKELREDIQDVVSDDDKNEQPQTPENDTKD